MQPPAALCPQNAHIEFFAKTLSTIELLLSSILQEAVAACSFHSTCTHLGKAATLGCVLQTSSHAADPADFTCQTQGTAAAFLWFPTCVRTGAALQFRRVLRPAT